LLNYLPLSHWLELMVPLDSLDMPNVQMMPCKGIKDRKLTRWPLMTVTPWRERLASRVDSWLEPFWERIVDWSSRKSLDRALAGADVFHCSTQLLYKPREVCTVVTVHDLSTLIFPEFHLQDTVELHKRKMRFVREQADLVIAVSENTRRDVIEHLGVPSDKVHVVYEAAGEQFQPVEDGNVLTAVTRRHGVESGRYLLYVGTLEPRKNLVRLVRAFSSV
jgi:glycosyltransferase involved in cell wall biosynthesis